jgi:molybdenum cofactor biosynthesis enzyme MoaA
MAKLEQAATAPARARAGLPIVADGSLRHPLLLRLPASGDGRASDCNNGCSTCLTQPLLGDESAWSADVAGRHVVLRDREPTLRRDLPQLVRELSARGAASVALLTNGRLLVYPGLARRLAQAGATRFIVKLFGLEAGAHDAHTRVPGSFAQAVAALGQIQAAGAEALVTYPLLPEGSRAEQEAERARRVALARELTGRDPVEMPEPEVVSHGGGYVFDLLTLRGRVASPLWAQSLFPMVHVNTGPVCNIRCVYCNVHGGDDQRLFDRAYVEQLIDAAAEALVPRRDLHGVLTLDLIGGEPTLHPDLAAFVARARARGFPQVTICTNGLLLLRPGYLDRLLDAGLTGVRFSLHDHRADVAEELADVGGVGPKYVEVAKLLLSRPEVYLSVFRILLGPTVDAVEDYVRWLAAHKTDGQILELVIGMPSMRGRMFEGRSWYPPLGGLREKVATALALADSLGIRANVHHAPACLVPHAPERSSCLHILSSQVEALSGKATPMNFEGDARYGAACESCAGRTGGCFGLPSAYFDADPAAAEGWLRPISYRPATLG